MMRVIQLIQKRQRRGAEIFATQLSNELVNQGHRVLLVSIFTHSPDLDPGIAEIRELDRPLQRRNFDPMGYWQLSQLIRAFAPDIVQANAGDTLKYAALSKLLFPWKGALVYRNANQMGDFFSFELQRYMYSKLLIQVDAVASVSQTSRENFKATFPKFHKEVTYLPIGIPTDQNTAAQELSDFLKGKKYLLQVGGLVREKTPLITLEVFESLAVDFPKLDLVFMGSGPLEKQLKEKTVISQYKTRIHFLPNQSNPFPILTQAQALVMPSKIEGLPAVILESMALRVPVIAYGVGGIPEVLSERTGYCIPPEDAQAFTEAIKTCLNSDNTAKLDAAQKLVLENYTIEKVAKQFEYFYMDLLSRNALNTRK